LNTRRDALFGLFLGFGLIATGAMAADTMDLARRLVRYTGGVSVVLRNFELGLAASVPAPAVFAQSFETAMQDNRSAIEAADEQIARTYAGLYPAGQMAAEIGFYESPEGKAIMDRNRAPTGAVVWPDPGSASLSAGESAALVQFNALVKQRAQIAAKDPKAMDQILSAETAALIKVRTAAFLNYCKVRDCKAEGVKLPPQ
jgi:hypothetical protein